MSETATPPREHVGGILGTSFALLLVAGLIAWMLLQRAHPIDPGEQLSAWFGPVELPFDLRPVEGARSPRGEDLVRLADPAAEPEAPRKELPKPVEGASPAPAIDWSELPVGPEGEPPREVLLVGYPRSLAEGEIPRLFRPGNVGVFSSGGHGGPMGGGRGGFSSPGQAAVGPEGGRREIDRGQLGWREFVVPYVVVREFEPGGTFRDSLRVNLSREDRPLALFARWPRGLPASKERVQELLDRLAG